MVDLKSKGGKASALPLTRLREARPLISRLLRPVTRPADQSETLREPPGASVVLDQALLWVPGLGRL